MITNSTQTCDNDIVYDFVPTIGDTNSKAHLYKDFYNHRSPKRMHSKKSSLKNLSNLTETKNTVSFQDEPIKTKSGTNETSNSKSKSNKVIIIGSNNNNTQNSESSKAIIVQPMDKRLQSAIIIPTQKGNNIKVNEFYHLSQDDIEEIQINELKLKNCQETQTEDSYFKSHQYLGNIRKKYYKGFLFKNNDICQYTKDQLDEGNPFQFSFGKKISMDNYINERLEGGKIKQNSKKEVYSNLFYTNSTIEKFKMGFYRRKHSFGCQADRFSAKKFFNVPNTPLGPGQYNTSLGDIDNKQEHLIGKGNLVNGPRNKYADYDWSVYKRMKGNASSNARKLANTLNNNMHLHSSEKDMQCGSPDALAEQILSDSVAKKKKYYKHKVEKFGIVLVEKIRFDTDSYVDF